jgi:hypothetical protein
MATSHTGLSRGQVIAALDNAVSLLRSYAQTSLTEAARVVPLVEDLTALRARFAQATAPDDSSTLVTNLVRETVSITLGLSTVEAYVDAEDPTRAHITLRAGDAPDSDSPYHGTARWDGEQLTGSDLTLSLMTEVNADAWDRLSAELRKAESAVRS